MRILFPFYGDEMVDWQYQAIHLALDLLDQGLNIKIGSQKLDCPIVDYLEWLGVDWLTIPFTAPMKQCPSWLQRRKRDQICSILVPFVDELGIDIVHTNSLRDHMIWSNLPTKTAIRHVWHERQASRSAWVTSFSNNANVVVLDKGCAISLARSKFLKQPNVLVLSDEKERSISQGTTNSLVYLKTMKDLYFNLRSL